MNFSKFSQSCQSSWSNQSSQSRQSNQPNLETTQPELYINDEDEMIVPQSEHCVVVGQLA